MPPDLSRRDFRHPHGLQYDSGSLPGSNTFAGHCCRQDPLWMTARWNRPADAGEARCAQTLAPPEEFPNTVTR
jgi:hypothetical protein